MTEGNGKKPIKPRGHRKKLNYDKLRVDYFEGTLNGKYGSLRDFCEKNELNYGTIAIMSSKQKWTSRLKELLNLSEDRIAILNAEKRMAAIERHEKLGVRLQDKGGKHLSRVRKMSAADTISAIRTGIAIEREALGMNEGDRPTVQIGQFQAVVNMVNNAGNGERKKFDERLLRDYGVGPKETGGEV